MRLAPSSVKQVTDHCVSAHRNSISCSVMAVIGLRKLGCEPSCASSSECVQFVRSWIRSNCMISGQGPRWIQSPTSGILNTCRIGPNFRQLTGAHSYAQAHFSTQPAPSLKDAWLPLAYEDQVGSSRAEPPSCHGPEARFSQCRIPRLKLSPPFRFGWSKSRINLLAGTPPVLP